MAQLAYSVRINVPSATGYKSTHFMVQFPKNHGFVGKSAMLEWVEEREGFQGCVALYGLGRYWVSLSTNLLEVNHGP